MLHEVIIPKTGIYMDDVEFLEWLVAEGSEVRQGDPILRIDSNKVEVDVEAEDPGWLHRVVEPPATLPIGAVVGHIASTREAYEAVAAGEAT